MKLKLDRHAIFEKSGMIKLYRIMRLTCLLFVIGLLQVSASGFSQKKTITISSAKIELAQLFKEVENKTEYKFFFNNDDVDASLTTKVSAADADVYHVLDEAFKDLPYAYKVLDDNLIFVHRKYAESSEIAQQQRIRGKVSGINGEPLPGVNVFIEGTTSGTITNIDGEYELDVNAPEAKLVFSFIGYETQIIAVSGRTEINVTLVDDVHDIEQVMVVAYGTAKKETFTGSAEIVKKDDLLKTSSNTVSKALLGRVAGVQVASYSAAAGDGAAIRIRGIGSANAASTPLYVVDGVAGAPVPRNEDIETLTILKDAAAASLYGSRAANGVIVITTKQGKGDTQVNVKYNKTLGWRSKSKFELMGADEYMSKAWEGLYNERKYFPLSSDNADQRDPVTYAHQELFNTVGYNPYYRQAGNGREAYDQPFDDSGNLKTDAQLLYDNDWLDAVYRTSDINDFHVSVSRGTEKGNVYTSLAYFDQKGILIGNDYKKINYTINATSKVGEKVEIGLNSNARYFEGRENRSLWDVYTFNNAIPIYERAGVTTGDYDPSMYNYGDIIHDASGKKVYHWNEVYYGSEQNPLAEIESYDEGYDGFNVFVSPFINYQPFKGLSLKGQASANLTKRSESYFYNPEHGSGVGVNGFGEKYEETYRTINAFAQATYEKRFNEHNIKATAVYEVEEYEYKTVSARGEDYSMWEINQELSAANEKKWISSGTAENARISYLGQLEYGLKDKYYLSGSYRRDGSSKFGPENRWGDFWSAGATWRLSEESFIKNLGYINNLKLRASYGVNGNDGIGNYKWQSIYGIDGDYNNQKAAYLDQIGNQMLAWEGNKNANIALEYKFFNRVYGTVEYYNRISDALLLYKEIGLYTGARGTNGNSRMENVGEIQNNGWEISIGAMLIDRPDFKWDANITYTANDNEILEWSGSNWSGDGQTYRDTGGSMYNLRMKKWAGVDAQTGGPLWYKEVLDADENPTGKTTVTNDWEDGSYYDVGDAAPDFFGAVNNNMTFKNFDLSFMFYYSVGNYAYNNVKGMVNSDGAQPQFNLEKAVTNSWQTPGEQAENPMYVHNDASHAWWRSTRFLQRSDFLKLKQVTLGYTLPKRWLDRVGLNNVRLYVMGENLWTLTDFTGYDPELGLNGDTSGWVVPPMTSVTFGVNLNF